MPKLKNKNSLYLLFFFTALVVLSYFFYSLNTKSKNTSSFLNTQSKDNFSADPIKKVYASLDPQAQKLYYQQSEELTKSVDPRLVELDQLTIGCFGPHTINKMSTSDKNLGGQCCGVLKDIEAYKLQLESLDEFIRENGDLDLIPKDPYDLPVAEAQELIKYDAESALTSEQQKIYDEAMEMSHHGGPCCCKCWKWYMMSGLAKNLITAHNWNEHQIAELWDISSSCGHAEDTNMYEHYKKDRDSSHRH